MEVLFRVNKRLEPFLLTVESCFQLQLARLCPRASLLELLDTASEVLSPWREANRWRLHPVLISLKIWQKI